MKYKVKQIGEPKAEKTAREGRFKVSLLRMQMVKFAPENDYIPEISFERSSAAIQYGVKNMATGKWMNQCIYCQPHELIKLRDAINIIIDGASEEEASDSLRGK